MAIRDRIEHVRSTVGANWVLAVSYLCPNTSVGLLSEGQRLDQFDVSSGSLFLAGAVSPMGAVHATAALPGGRTLCAVFGLKIKAFVLAAACPCLTSHGSGVECATAPMAWQLLDQHMQRWFSAAAALLVAREVLERF